MFYDLVNLAVAAGIILILVDSGVPLGEAAIASALWGIFYALADTSRHMRRE